MFFLINYVVVTFIISFLIILILLSAQKGSSVNMLKAGSKRRRTKAQVKAEKEEALLRDLDI